MYSLGVLLLIVTAKVSAATLFFDASELFGTEKMANIQKAEFLFEDSGSQLRQCGYWKFADGAIRRFEYLWELEGSHVKKNGKTIGSYYDGNILVEEAIDTQGLRAMEISRMNETFFEIRANIVNQGFVDGDGWLKSSASDRLKTLCLN